MLCTFRPRVETGYLSKLYQGRVRCHDHEKAALLLFKKSFLIDCNASTPPFAYPKTKSWPEHEVVANGSSISDCCAWDGVECHKESSFVIALDLSSSCLSGTFPSNSSLFSLDHLTDLNLADNCFKNSHIPSSIGRLYRLQSLNLSESCFYGVVPPTISSLSSLSVLDLSNNGNPRGSYGLDLLSFGDFSLDKLVTNLTRLTQLCLDNVDISSAVPPVLSNMTSLTTLSLASCQLYGKLPQGILQLPNLEVLYLSTNLRLKGHLPEFHPHSPLRILHLEFTALSGELPTSIGNLVHLTDLYVTDASFSGHIPASLGNLTRLVALMLADNHFSGTMPSSLTNLTNLVALSLSGLNVSPVLLDSWLPQLNKLTLLDLHGMNMGPKIPSILANITGLNILSLEDSQLSGTLPEWFGNLTQLTRLQLSDNQLEGPIPPCLFKLVNLQILVLSDTNFVGNFDQFLRLPNIQLLYLDGLSLTFLPNASTNSSSLLKLNTLSLSSCNLTEFPQILKYQSDLEYLYLGGNDIGGHVPQWFMNTTKESLLSLDLSDNSLVGFEHPLLSLPWTNLLSLDLSYNKLRGQLPVPLNAMEVFDISYNHIHGAIPKQICLAHSLTILNLSNNSMIGHIPHCIAHQMGNSLQELNLRGNKFRGTIPSRFYKSCSLKMINLSENQLEGQLPRSLANCTMLEVLDLGKNRVNDTFPSWLGSHSALQVLVLRHNNFHGEINDNPNSSQSFARLRIIDLSYNFHVGTLPSSYLQSWLAMQGTREGKSSSSNSVITISNGDAIAFGTFNYVITITNKGSETLYPRVLNVIRVVDFSSNSFTGKIPSILGNLKGIQALNLSNNHFEGEIPSSLSEIINLEALDLAQNMLSGTIPRELSKLTFLEIFNVSHNRLLGPIPQGDQFNTFDNTCFSGNLGLCGSQLSNKCGVVPAPPEQETEDVEEEDSDMIGWIVRGLGCVSGLIVGFVIGKLYITDKYHVWFVRTFGGKRKPKTRGRRASNRTMNR